MLAVADVPQRPRQPREDVKRRQLGQDVHPLHLRLRADRTLGQRLELLEPLQHRPQVHIL